MKPIDFSSASRPPDADAVERSAGRVLGYLRQAGARIVPADAGYQVRLGEDGRTRPVMRFDEVVFRRLAEQRALVRVERGWGLSRTAVLDAPEDRAGRPGVEAGERELVDDDGRVVRRRANLGESPIAWLARRRDARGRPWLSRPELAAAERLRNDFERCAVQGRLTMDWSGMPRSGAGWAGIDPAEHDRAAKQRVAAALDAAGPGLRELLERVVLRGTALEAAERRLDLPRRAGKTVLKLALARLADHYGLG